jgi:hypothetical protein
LQMAGTLSGESAGRAAGWAATGGSPIDYVRTVDAGEQHALEQRAKLRGLGNVAWQFLTTAVAFSLWQLRKCKRQKCKGHPESSFQQESAPVALTNPLDRPNPLVEHFRVASKG